MHILAEHPSWLLALNDEVHFGGRLSLSGTTGHSMSEHADRFDAVDPLLPFRSVGVLHGFMTTHSRLPALAAASMAAGSSARGKTLGLMVVTSSAPLRTRASTLR